jgi:hypothetical protein
MATTTTPISGKDPSSALVVPTGNNDDDDSSKNSSSLAHLSTSSGNQDESSTGTPSQSSYGQSTGSPNGIVSARDDSVIRFSRLAFLFVLLTAAVTIATVVYLITADEERDNFKQSVSFISRCVRKDPFPFPG